MDQKHENRIGVSEVFAIDLAAFTNATGVIINDEADNPIASPSSLS